MLRVSSISKSVQFYTEYFGMQVVRKIDKADGKSVAFIGYGDEDKHTVLEIVQDPSVPQLAHGNRFGHIALGVVNSHALIETLRSAGITIRREPQMKPGNELIGSIEDPDGYKVELIEKLA